MYFENRFVIRIGSKYCKDEYTGSVYTLLERVQHTITMPGN